MRRDHRRAPTTTACALAAALLLAACGGASRGAAPAAAAGMARDTLSAACAAPDTAADALVGIAIDATVRAKEVQFREAPRTGVRLSGTPGTGTLSCTQRTNLPRPVRAGETYRDVEVRWRLRATTDTARLPGADSAAAGAAPQPQREGRPR